MELSKSQLTELLDAQIKSVMASSEFSDTMKKVFEDKFNELKNNVVTPMSKENTNILTSTLGFARTDGKYLTTSKGSIINIGNKKSPWVALSKEMEDWTHAFAKYIKNGRVDKLLQESSDTAGGYLVPEEFRAIMIMYDSEPTLVWNRATVWPMGGEKMSFPKLAQEPDVDDADYDHFAGVTFAWTEEGGTKAETEPEFALVELVVHELAGYTEITNTLLDDSAINIINFITTLFRAAWYWITDRYFIRGTGGKQPLGVINDPMVLTVPRATASTVVVDDIIDMDTKLPAVFDANAVWFISKKVRGALRKQKVSASSDELVLQETYKDFSDGYSATMLGRPVILGDGKLPAMGTAGDVILADWRWYYIGFRQDFSMDSSVHYKFRNNRTAMRCSGRLDGQASMGQAFVILSDPS